MRLLDASAPGRPPELLVEARLKAFQSVPAAGSGE
jgi:hypothetical protein